MPAARIYIWCESGPHTRSGQIMLWIALLGVHVHAHARARGLHLNHDHPQPHKQIARPFFCVSTKVQAPTPIPAAAHCNFQGPAAARRWARSGVFRARITWPHVQAGWMAGWLGAGVALPCRPLAGGSAGLITTITQHSAPLVPRQVPNFCPASAPGWNVNIPGPRNHRPGLA